MFPGPGVTCTLNPSTAPPGFSPTTLHGFQELPQEAGAAHESHLLALSASPHRTPWAECAGDCVEGGLSAGFRRALSENNESGSHLHGQVCWQQVLLCSASQAASGAASSLRHMNPI